MADPTSAPTITPANGSRTGRWLAPVLFAGLLLAPACDNPTCVFGPGNCQTGGNSSTGIGSEPASTPEDGALILDAAPQLDFFAPRGAGAHPETPIYLEFSESLSPDSLLGAFELVNDDSEQVVPTTNPPATAAAGRVVVLVPFQDLPPGASFSVRVAQGKKVTDLTGQQLASGGTLGSFTIAEEPTATPRILATFPADNSEDQSDLGAIVVAFDRKMDISSVDNSSIQVTIDGQEPEFDPDPTPVFATAGFVPVVEVQVFEWRSVDDDGLPVSLGRALTVEVEVSGAGATIEPSDEDSEDVPTSSFSFDLAAARTPSAVFKDPASEPIDAIGAPNLEDPDMPVVFVEFAEPYALGDKLGVFVFGLQAEPADGSDAIQIARLREVSLPEPVADSAVITAADLGLFGGNSLARFQDGELNIAVRLQRGSLRSALRLFDSDPDEAGPQALLFDITPPTLTGLGTGGVPSSIFLSDARDLVLVGLASEELARVTVSATDGVDMATNLDAELIAEVASSNRAGLFVARPVPLGVLDPAGADWAFTATIYDRALNPAAEPATGGFLQRGGLAVGGVPSADMISVSVFDALTLAPLPGALVIAHQNDAGTYTLIETQVTGAADGSVDIEGATSGETVLTVDLEDYDLFTFSGVLGTSISIPLQPTLTLAPVTQGTVLSSLDVDIGNDTKLVGDSRVEGPGDPLLAVGNCDPDVITNTRLCEFGPVDIEPARLGGRSFLSANFGLTAGTFSSVGFLRSFAASLPAPPALPGATDIGFFQIESVLLNQSAERLPIATPQATISEPISDAWGTLDASPEVTIEATGPGLSRGLPVGLGLAFEQTGDPWLVFGAYAGQADGILETSDDELGELVAHGTLDADLLYRIELADDLGNRVGIRPRLSSSLLDTPDLVPLEPPALRSPAAGEVTGGSSFDLVFDDVALDAFGQDALYRVQLSDALGRTWTLWRRDEAGDPPTISLKVPNIGAAGGTPLSDGNLRAQVSCFVLPDLDLDADALVWDDIERRYERFGHAAAVSFVQGP